VISAEYKVVDQNYLREPNPELHRYLSAGNYAVFPDIAAMESFKGDALINLRRSLEIICRYPGQVVVLRDTQTIIRVTQRGGRALRRLLIDPDQTEGFDNFCMQTYAVDPMELSPELAEIEQKANAAKAFFEDKLKSTKLILRAIGTFHKAFPPEQLKELRADAAYSPELFSRILKHVLLVTAKLMKGQGFLLKKPSQVRSNYLFRFALAGYLLAIRWVAKGGQSHLPLAKLQNDVDDMQYVAYATYYDGLLSKDKKMNEMYERTRLFLDRC
jgi:hypothetical protein